MPRAANRPRRRGTATVEFTDRPVELTHLALGWRAPSASSDDRYALAVLNHLFGAGPSSLLFQEIREARGLTYSVVLGARLSTSTPAR